MTLQRRLILAIFFATIAIASLTTFYAYKKLNALSCQAKLRPFKYAGKDYANSYRPLPGSYTAYGLVDSTDVNPSDIKDPITQQWNNLNIQQNSDKQLKQISLVAVGDVIPHADLQVAAAMQGGYQHLFDPIKPTIQAADLAIANLETPIADKPPSGECYVFNASTRLLDALKTTGFNVLLTANNHAMDQGTQGYIDTINAIKKFNILPLGDNINPQSANSKENVYHIVDMQGFRLGLVNYTFLSNNPPPQPSPFKFLPIEKQQLPTITHDIQQLRQRGANYVIVFFHWGAKQEYHRYPEKRLQQLAHQLILNGADMIIGAHPYVIQPIELVYTKNQKLVPANTADATPHAIVYSLGNFVSHQRGLAGYGLMLNFKLAKQGKKVVLSELTPSVITNTITVKTRVMPNQRAYTYIDFQVKQASFKTFLDYIRGHLPKKVNSQ